VPEQENRCKKLDRQTREVHHRIGSLLEDSGGRGWVKLLSAPAPAQELLELLRLYPQFRYQYLVQIQVTAIYQALLNDCPHHLAEISLCRTQLKQLSQALESRLASRHADVNLGPGQTLLPRGCESVREAVSWSLHGLAAEDILRFDRQVQDALSTYFKGLKMWCRSPANSITEMEILLQEQGEAFVHERLSANDVAAIFLDRLESDDAAADELAAAFDEAIPLGAGSREELSILAIPTTANTDRVRALANRISPSMQLVSMPGADDLVIYRERSGIVLARLPQLGAQGRSAYAQLAALEYSSPHCRCDISSWLPIPAE
jgi:hypothetical protein